MGLSDILLSGSLPNLQAVHAEPIQVIGSGPDSGKFFSGIIEIEPDFVFDGEVSNDRRSKRVVRFPVGKSPNLKKLDKLKTQGGRVWTATIMPGIAFLTVDFELIETI